MNKSTIVGISVAVAVVVLVSLGLGLYFGLSNNSDSSSSPYKFEKRNMTEPGDSINPDQIDLLPLYGWDENDWFVIAGAGSEVSPSSDYLTSVSKKFLGFETSIVGAIFNTFVYNEYQERINLLETQGSIDYSYSKNKITLVDNLGEDNNDFDLFYHEYFESDFSSSNNYIHSSNNLSIVYNDNLSEDSSLRIEYFEYFDIQRNLSESSFSLVIYNSAISEDTLLDDPLLGYSLTIIDYFIIDYFYDSECNDSLGGFSISIDYKYSITDQDGVVAPYEGYELMCLDSPLKF